MVAPELTVFVIDGDVRRRDELALVLGRASIRFQLFSGEVDLMASIGADAAGCVLAEWHAPAPGNESELRLVRRLKQKGLALPVIYFGSPETPGEVRLTFRSGATDFLFDPVDPDELVARIGEAFSVDRQRATVYRRSRQRESLFGALTRREREVASLAAQGHDNQLIGQRLGISHRTVEVHKSRLMKKLGARSLADLIRLGVHTQR